LQKFKQDEWEAMVTVYERGVEVIKAMLTNGLDYAMNQYNMRD
jgi:peptidyl-tRNA hydrolase